MMYTTTERPPAVAGLFYPGDAGELRRAVEGYFESAVEVAGDAKAVIAPHAGYIYSGPTAGYAFAALRGRAGTVRRVVLLGPAHRVPVRGLALPAAESFATPLGTVPVDGEMVAAVSDLPQVAVSAEAHVEEHSLEVELPFLQTVLDEFTALPLVVGEATPAEVAEVLDRVWGGEETAIVISSDLSHYLPYDDAVETDRATVDKILALEGSISPQQACGARPINGLLAVAARHGLRPHLLDLRNSGDTAGDRHAVVGYTAVSFVEGAGERVH